MNIHYFQRLAAFFTLFSFCLQMLILPYAQAQGRGIFVREETSQQDTGTSFRTVEEGEERSRPGMGLGGMTGVGARGLREQGGVLQKKQIEGMEGVGLRESLGAGGLIYQIHVVGEVGHPGTYRIPVSTRASEALLLAGGIKKNGSERNIELRRSQAPKRKIDLVAYKLFGKLEDNPYLMDNDVIYVPLKQRAIEVEGAVKRSGFYELKNERTLADAIRLAGGLTQGASRKDPIRIIRYDSEEKKNVIEIRNDEEELRTTELLSGDVIVVPHIFTTENRFDYNLKELPNDNLFYPSFEDRVFVIGAVEVPGAYTFNQHYRLSHYLAIAGGMTRMAKKNIKIVTPDGKEVKTHADNDKILINPGDTVYVPERVFSRETWISLFTTLASLGLSAASTAIVLSK